MTSISPSKPIIFNGYPGDIDVPINAFRVTHFSVKICHFESYVGQ